MGQCIALYIVGALEWGIVAFSNWDHQVKKAFERMDEGERMESGDGNGEMENENEVFGEQGQER